MKILLALKGKQERTNKIGTALQAKAAADGFELTYDSVVSEVAIRNKMSGSHYDAVITMSTLESRPFTIEALTSISEIDETTKLIIVMPDNARGTDYCANLLKNNLVYGVYMSDAKVPMLYSLICEKRTRGEARAYYEIVINSDREEKLEKGIVPEEIRSMAHYITYGANGLEESLEDRVNYMAKHCTEAEKEAVFASLSEEMRDKVRTIPAYAKYFFDSASIEEDKFSEQTHVEIKPAPKLEVVRSNPAEEVEEKKTVPEENEEKKIVALNDRKQEKKDNETVVQKPVKKEPATVKPKETVKKKDSGESTAKKMASEAISGIKNLAGIFSRTEKPSADSTEKSHTTEGTRLVSRRVIGVLGSYSGAGTTTTAVCLAKTIAQYEPVTLIEMPRNGASGIYEAYSLDRNVGPGFKSVPHMIAGNQLDLSQVSNMYEGINFFVANNSYGYEPLTNEQLALMLNGTSDNVVVDLGASLEEVCEKGIANLLTHIVLVYANSNGDRYLSKIKSDVSQIETMNLVPMIVCVEDKGSSKTEAIGSVCVLHSKSVIGNKVIPLGLSASDRKQLYECIGLSASTKRIIKSGQKKTRGVIDVALVGSRSGIGTTYTALMLADSLRKGNKVAYFEYNNSEDMQHLASEFNSEEANHISLSGVDIFYDMDYSEFATSYRNDYDYVFVDFGTVTKLNKKRDIFASCNIKYICIPSTPWKVCDIDYDIETIDELDPIGNICLLAPLSTKKTLKNYNMFKRCGRREIIPIPYSEEPIGCTEEVASYLRRFFK